MHGRLREDAGTWLAGSPYSAHDPEAQLWVLLTLADTSERVFERFVRPFHGGEREALWADWRAVGIAFGLSRALLPADYAGYRARIEELLGADAVYRGREELTFNRGSGLGD